MKKFIVTIFALSLIIMLTSCSKDNSSNEFFAWMDAYIATTSQAEDTIAVTLFFKEKPFSIEDVINISFLDLDSKDVSISSFDIQESEIPNKKYNSYDIILTYSAGNIGMFKTTGVQINLSNSDKSLFYKIGDWTFDINNEDTELINTWSSPAASSNNKELAYDYTMNAEGAKMTGIYYAPDSFVMSATGLESNGKISLEDYYNSPIVYIKTKINLELDDKRYINYGKGCYCGALDTTDADIIEMSREQNSSS